VHSRIVERFRGAVAPRASLYEITVENPGRRNRGVAEAVLDGVRVNARAIPLVDDGAVHGLRVVMGESEPETSPTTTAETSVSLVNSPDR
jgi:hypothetical protein